MSSCKLKYLLTLSLFFVTVMSHAQFPSELWHEGKIVLVNSDTIKGNIKYDLDRDIIQVNNKNGIEAYTAKKVLYFNFFDDTSHQYRQFYALPYRITSEYKTPVFFEVFLQGKMTLLGREFITVKTVSYGNTALSGSSYSQQVLAYRYYFLDDQGEIERLQKNKRQLYQIFKKKESEIKQYVKRNRFRFDNKSDMMQLTEYYNRLITPETNE